MPNNCPYCEKVFYSDTEFEQHLLIEEQKQILKELSGKQSQLTQIFCDALGRITQELRIANFLAIIREYPILKEEEVAKRHLEYWNLINKVSEEQKAKENKKNDYEKK